MKTLISVLGVFASLVIIAVWSFVSSYNYGNSAEQQIKALYTNNQNILAQYSQKVREAAQVPDMYKDAVKEVVTAALSGRYGDGGSKAVFQWIQEQNPTIDPAVYIKVQQIVEAGRNEFQTAQTRLIDEKRLYETSLGYLWKGLWLRVAGYPKIRLDDYKVILNDYTTGVFESGKESGPIKLR